MQYEDEYAVQSNVFDTPRAAAGIVLGALLALFLIRRGFRGVSVSAAIK